VTFCLGSFAVVAVPHSRQLPYKVPLLNGNDAMPTLTVSPVPSQTPGSLEANTSSSSPALETPAESVARQDEETVIPAPLPIDMTAPTVAVTVAPIPVPTPTPEVVPIPTPFPSPCHGPGNSDGHADGWRRRFC
jgi:hypothetical protein